MVYDYACTNEECGNVQEENHSVEGFKEFTPKCAECGNDCKYQWTPSIPQVAFLDGPTGSWPSKGNHFKEFRRKQSEKMEKRQYDRYGDAPKRGAVPNYQGKDTGTWAEAQFQALKDKGAESAATFVPKVSEEKAAAEKGKIKI